jgi:hypothetical protein
MRWAAIVVGTALIGVGTGLLAGGHALPASGATVGVSPSNVGISVPAVGVSVPSVGVSVPSVGISVPSVGVTVPSVGVTVPSVGVTVPGVTVSTPSIGATTPTVTVSTPSAPGTGSTEPTGTGGGQESPPSGAGAPPSPGESPSTAGDHSGSSSARPPSDSTRARAASVSGATGAGQISASGSPVKAHVGSPTSAAAHAHGHHLGGPGDRGAAVGAGATQAIAHTSLATVSSSRKTSPSRRLEHHTSNPLDAIGKHIPLPIPVPDWSKPIILVLLLLAIWFGVRSRLAVRRARRLEARQATLLRDVGAMQAALVPEVPARVGGLAVSVAYRPAEGPAAGGDFYDVFVPERGKVAIILGDVAGHGHRALKQAALTRYTLRAYLQTGLEPRAALALAGRVLGDPKTEHFATVAVAVYDTREARLTYASAGHPPPILHGLTTREPLTVCASPPIGWTVPTGRRQTIVSLPPGAVACFFSDGLVEARCKGDLLGRERLSEILGALGARPDAAKLLARVRSAAIATPDDMVACILLPEVTVIAGHTHIEELEADAETLGAGQVRRFLETCQVPTPDIERTIERAGSIAAVYGTAMVRVELAGLVAAATVTAHDAGVQAGVSARRPQTIGGPSGGG